MGYGTNLFFCDHTSLRPEVGGPTDEAYEGYSEVLSQAFLVRLTEEGRRRQDLPEYLTRHEYGSPPMESYIYGNFTTNKKEVPAEAKTPETCTATWLKRAT